MVVAATIGSAVVGGVVAHNSASDANDTAKAGQQQASDASAAELAFAQQQYDDWQAVYGDFQTNLGEYYSNLTSNNIEVQGLQAIETERANALKRINESFAQRGIQASGLAAATETSINISTAEQRAKVRADAPLKVAQEKSRFLQIGLGQNPQNNVQQALSGNSVRTQNLANQQLSIATTAANQAGEAVSGAIGSIFGAIT